MRIDDSLKLAGQLLAAHMKTTSVPERKIAGALNRLRQDVVRIRSGVYSAWQDELPDADVLGPASRWPIRRRRSRSASRAPSATTG